MGPHDDRAAGVDEAAGVVRLVCAGADRDTPAAHASGSGTSPGSRT
ncbi:hypothetical protein ACIQX5_30625 [Bacillus thuringiensis]